MTHWFVASYPTDAEIIRRMTSLGSQLAYQGYVIPVRHQGNFASILLTTLMQSVNLVAISYATIAAALINFAHANSQDARLYWDDAVCIDCSGTRDPESHPNIEPCGCGQAETLVGVAVDLATKLLVYDEDYGTKYDPSKRERVLL